MDKQKAQKKAIDEIYNKKGDFKEKKEPRYDTEGGKVKKESKGYKCEKCGQMVK